jgi:hypothetical protein
MAGLLPFRHFLASNKEVEASEGGLEDRGLALYLKVFGRAEKGRAPCVYDVPVEHNLA